MNDLLQKLEAINFRFIEVGNQIVDPDIIADMKRYVKLNKEYEMGIKSNKIAWSYFQSLPASYKQPSIWWVMSAKKEDTRLRRLKKLIECSAKQQILPQFLKPSPAKKKK